MAANAILKSGNVHFWTHNCVPCKILNILTMFGEDLPNSKDLATVFRNSKWRRPPSRILANVHIWYDSCILLQITNILINAPCESISTKLYVFLGPANVITCLEMALKFPLNFTSRQVENACFSFESQLPI